MGEQCALAGLPAAVCEGSDTGIRRGVIVPPRVSGGRRTRAAARLRPGEWEDAMITGIFHTCFTVSDLDRSIDFYASVIGMKVIRRVDSAGDAFRAMTGLPDAQIRMAYLEMDGRYVELIQYTAAGGGRAEYRHNDVRAAHLAFFADDVARTAEELQAIGVRLASPPQTAKSGRSAVYFYDPDGNVLELCDPM
jgi:catechol 2,3-dioxygenase-like lactoylglutathione lyase family enzyme